jgi:hypothetical protein
MAQCTTAAAVPLPMVMCDYLGYVPFVDQSITDPQTVTGTTITRYTSGAGVQMMMVMVAPQTGSRASFNITYTNSEGVAGRVTPLVTSNNTALVNGSIVTSASALAGTCGPFIPLQSGDSGVRSIQSIAFTATDVGLCSLVMVKPLANLHLYDITAPSETDLLVDQAIAPAIQDDAYLNFICLPNGSLSGAVITGTIETYWT